VEILQGIFQKDPELAEALLHLLNEVELARLETQPPQKAAPRRDFTPR
jgi:hypothetical protein